MSNENSIAKRLPGYSARHATQHARRLHRAVITVIVVVVVAIGATIFTMHLRPSHKTLKATPPVATKSSSHLSPSAMFTASAEPWTLTAPLSGGLALPGGAGQLVILGGATTGDVLAQGIFALNDTTGTLKQVGDLTTNLDDTAGAVVGTDLIAFGGASPDVLGSVQSWSLSNVTTSSSGDSPSSVVGMLPTPRANEAVVEVGADLYLVGGDSGTSSDPDVLETTEGTTFKTVATLSVPVRSPAVVAVGHELYVFGGVAEAGPDAGQPIDAIQDVNLKSHKSSVTGHLPHALAGAAAAVVGGQVVIIGGDAQSAVAASGSTGAINATTGTSSAIWTFDPKNSKVTSVGELSTPVAYSAATVVGTTVWLVGGETNGVPVANVQTVTES